MVWTLSVVVVLVSVSVVFWPREDAYRFIRALDPSEAVRTVRYGPMSYDERVFSFSQPPDQVEQVLLAHYFSGRRENYGLPVFTAGTRRMDFQWTTDGSWPEGIRCRVVVNEGRPWLDRQIDAIRQFLHI